jgi:hypothetical protein
MRHITPSRIALAGALLALLATGMPSAVGFYVSLMAAAILLGAGSMAYVQAVDEPSALAAVDLVACAIIAMLVLADVAVRFPAVFSSTVPTASRILAETATVLALAGTLLQTFATFNGGHLPDFGYARADAGPGAAIQRSLKRWWHRIDTAF